MLRIVLVLLPVLFATQALASTVTYTATQVCYDYCKENNLIRGLDSIFGSITLDDTVRTPGTPIARSAVLDFSISVPKNGFSINKSESEAFRWIATWRGADEVPYFHVEPSQFIDKPGRMASYIVEPATVDANWNPLTDHTVFTTSRGWCNSFDCEDQIFSDSSDGSSPAIFAPIPLPGTLPLAIAAMGVLFLVRQRTHA